ncbi:MAG: tRNA (adenosine(37)-N6)-threonylcarbamoyltransferase complex dimerization subunit type 1 TsaB, partial [Gammaproteobacteria bacterium]|nr:tRNA (adenosine(37)-N6)-threonylcarbamoyltransferase complex dimerization subunit type 1 TsaB [Gammaproteobacteria bacterium]
MKLLALDAATEACSAALLLDDRVIERFQVIGRGHAEHLLPMVDEVLAAGGMALRSLDAVAFGCGPGGFTGLRIAAGLTQGLAAGAGLPVLPVSNLAALAAAAAAAAATAQVLACLDARMGEVYWAVFDCTGAYPMPLTAEAVSRPAAVDWPG